MLDLMSVFRQTEVEECSKKKEIKSWKKAALKKQALLVNSYLNKICLFDLGKKTLFVDK